jgi:hypothetical protein
MNVLRSYVQLPAAFLKLVHLFQNNNHKTQANSNENTKPMMYVEKIMLQSKESTKDIILASYIPQ